MRVPIPHSLPKEEVRRRLRDKSPQIGNFVPGGIAEVDTSWADEDHMNLNVRAMGQTVAGQVVIEEGQVVFVVDLPPALSFVEPMIAGAIRQHGAKLLGPPKAG